LLKREKSKTGKNENGVDVIALRSNLSKASVLKLAEINPDIIPILMRHGIRCIGCAGYEDETIEQAAEANNSDLTKLLKELETAI